MDFAFTPEQERFRDEVEAFIRAELPPGWMGMFVEDEAVWAFIRRFCRRLAERGWLTPAWPPEYGGRGADLWEQQIIKELMWTYDEPRGPQYMNVNYIGPTIMTFGTAEQKQRFLPPMARGEAFWCQGFSEPTSGSDLVSLRTRAVPDGDDFLIDGQKIWTSYARTAQWCFLLARTDPAAAPHKGLSVFLVDMNTPGIIIRPIRSMAGDHELHELFFDRVRVPRANLLGPLGGGWQVITTGLNLERTGIARYARSARILRELVAYVREHGLADDPAIRERLGEAYCRLQQARLLNYRLVSLQAAEEPLQGHEASLARIHSTLLDQHMSDLALDILGSAGLLEAGAPGAPLDGRMALYWRMSVASTIAAGTVEVQKNLVATKGLRLPRGR